MAKIDPRKLKKRKQDLEKRKAVRESYAASIEQYSRLTAKNDDTPESYQAYLDEITPKSAAYFNNDMFRTGFHAAQILAEFWKEGVVEENPFKMKKEGKELPEILAPWVTLIETAEYMAGIAIAREAKAIRENKDKISIETVTASTEMGVELNLFPILCSNAEKITEEKLVSGELSLSDEAMDCLNDSITKFKESHQKRTGMKF